MAALGTTRTVSAQSLAGLFSGLSARDQLHLCSSPDRHRTWDDQPSRRDHFSLYLYANEGRQGAVAGGRPAGPLVRAGQKSDPRQSCGHTVRCAGEGNDRARG